MKIYRVDSNNNIKRDTKKCSVKNPITLTKRVKMSLQAYLRWHMPLRLKRLRLKDKHTQFDRIYQKLSRVEKIDPSEFDWLNDTVICKIKDSDSEDLRRKYLLKRQQVYLSTVVVNGRDREQCLVT